jgi:hypothetical protein
MSAVQIIILVRLISEGFGHNRNRKVILSQRTKNNQEVAGEAEDRRHHVMQGNSSNSYLLITAIAHSSEIPAAVSTGLPLVPALPPLQDWAKDDVGGARSLLPWTIREEAE